MKRTRGRGDARTRWRTGALFVLGVLASFASSRPLFGQCPDGSPPPCERRPARPGAAAPALDPNRIAILPFRVTTADSLLGEGVAELLSAEFTGERGPRAAHMGSVLRAWRRAGGAPRSPLPPPDAIRAARGIGAGLVVDGSIVGLGQRLTLSASVVSVPDGRARRATPVSGSADSLDVLLRRFSTNLIAAAGGEARATERGVLTESPAAMRHYLEGLQAWRRYTPGPAAAAFEAAFREDSTFARAAFMRMVTASWGASNRPRWERITFGLRDRLSAADRLLLTAYIGDHYPTARTPAQQLADRQRAATQLPESPEAQYVLGDWLYHYGATANVVDRLPQSIRLFERSLALDSQETVLHHLAEVAALAYDTALLRQLRGPLERATGNAWPQSWLDAALLGDEEWLERLRQRPQFATTFAVALFSVAGLPTPRLAEGLGLLERATSRPNDRAFLVQIRYATSLIQGRPGEAQRLADSLMEAQGVTGVAILAGVVAEGDTAHARQAAFQAAASPARLDLTCALALWRAQRGEDTPGMDSLPRMGGATCHAVVRAELARVREAPGTDALLATADSIVRHGIGRTIYFGFENLVLARAFEARGNPRKALEAVRLRPHAIGMVWSEAPAARMEGRLAAALGDTDAAIDAYRRYLRMRRDPEPSLVPQRDSVAAELARLVRP